MTRLKAIQDLYSATCENRRVSNPNAIFSALYLSVYEDEVVTTDDLVQSVVGNPLYVICFVKVPSVHFNGNRYLDIKHFAFINQDSLSVRLIELNCWSIKSIRINNSSEAIDSAEIFLNGNPTHRCELDFGTFNLNNSLKISANDFWSICKEIDLNCATVKEADIYLKYILERYRSANNQLTLKEYQVELEESRKIKYQYKDLLEDIKSLVK